MLACVSKQVPIGDQTGSTGSGGVASAGSGGSPAAGGASGAGGGSDGGASGGTGGGADAASGIDAGSCATGFTSALMKDCSTAADCMLVSHNDCCGTVVVAIRTGTDSSFAAAEQAYQACVPGCAVRGCFHADFAENGQMLTSTGQAFAAECQSGQCTSIVTTGPTCTVDTDCGAGEICTAFVSNLGPTSTTSLVCRGNPCGASTLSCACASSICTGFYSGLCSVNNNGRLTCDDGRQ